MEGQRISGRPAHGLVGLVTGYVGYRYTGARPGVHLGLPSASLTAIVSIDGPVVTLRPPEPAQGTVALHALVSGLHVRAAQVQEPGHGCGISVGLTPAGARSLLGMPTAELGGWVLPLDELLGPSGRELVDRLHSACTWPERFTVLDDVLLRCRDRGRSADPAVQRAWTLLQAGAVRVTDVAAAVGYSPRHLSTRFAREYGLPPKVLARLSRFDRSRQLLQVAQPPSLATVAAACGFTDQAHLAREWRAFAGAPPTAWRAGEDLLFVQDRSAELGEP